VNDLARVSARSLADLAGVAAPRRLVVYDTQVPFYAAAGCYPVPDIIAACGWIDVLLSRYRPDMQWGTFLAPRTTNQNLEALTYADDSVDIVITSDVMEHVRLYDKAHKEIRRVLRPGGVYLFTVPHLRESTKNVQYVTVVDPSDSTKDRFETEPVYHIDGESADGKVLAYRAYGTELDQDLASLGFSVNYEKLYDLKPGILDTELFYCRLKSKARL
jgi:SAM-dependent methyltransferase